MNLILFAVVFLITATVGDNIPDDTLRQKSQRMISLIRKRINLFIDYDAKELIIRTLPLEMKYFVYKIKYDEPILSLRQNILKELSKTDHDTVNKCNKDFHKKLHLLINAEAKEAVTSAKQSLRSVVNGFEHHIRILAQVERLMKVKNESSYIATLTSTKLQVNLEIHKALKVPSEIREKWIKFENSEDIIKLTEETEKCYRNKESEKKTKQRDSSE